MNKTLSSKRRKLVILDSDFNDLEEAASPKRCHEPVDECSSGDDFLVRTQSSHAKKRVAKSSKKNLAKKFKSLNLRELRSDKFYVLAVIHSKNKVKTADSVRL